MDIWFSQDEFSRVYTYPCTQEESEAALHRDGEDVHREVNGVVGKTKKQQAEGVLCEKSKNKVHNGQGHGRRKVRVIRGRWNGLE